MRIITTHHDGHGLNEAITISADERDPGRGGASYTYRADMEVKGKDSLEFVGFVNFQRGPRHVETSKPGVTEAVLYAILLDRLEAFQEGPYPHPENERQIEYLRECLASTKRRADERAARGVLGTNAV